MTPADVVSEYASLVTAVKQGLQQMQQEQVHPDVLRCVVLVWCGGVRDAQDLGGMGGMASREGR